MTGSDEDIARLVNTTPIDPDLRSSLFECLKAMFRAHRSAAMVDASKVAADCGLASIKESQELARRGQSASDCGLNARARASAAMEIQRGILKLMEADAA